MRQSPSRLLIDRVVLGLLSGDKERQRRKYDIWYIAISSIYSSFWCETSRNWEGQLFFHFNFFFSCHFFSMHPHPSRKKNVSRFLVRPSWWPCRFHQKHCSAFSASRSFSQCRPLTKPRSCEFERGNIVTYCYILKNPYTEETLKIFHQGHISCWYEKFVCLRIFLVGIRGPVAYETVAWRWLKPFPFRTLAIGQGWLHFQHDNLWETCTFIISWGKAMDPKLLLKNFGKRWSMSCQHLVWTNLHLKNSRPKLDKAQISWWSFSYSICPITCRF